MNDKILKMFFERERWEKAIQKGVVKDIRQDQLMALASEKTRIAIAEAMMTGKYCISPPHTAQIPKDDGTFRTVYVNEPMDRVWLSIANDLLYDLMPEMIHPTCKSYQIGIGCGKVVQEASRKIVAAHTDGVLGWKSDLSKYFDSVPLRFIDEAFDKVEAKHGKSCVIDVLRKYYHCDLFFDENNELHSAFQSLKQGCAVASWLANVLLYDLDDELSKLNGFYVRYSDDMLYIGQGYEAAMDILVARLAEKEMRLNPKKVEYLTPTKWFKFLGYSIKGDKISLSSTRIKKFQHEIEARTIKSKSKLSQAVQAVNRYLYKGNGEFSWATAILPVCNVRHDIDELNKFVMDCLRAVATGKHKVGGLGYVSTNPNDCIVRGIGRNVTANRAKTDNKIAGYLTIGCMQNAILTNRAVYNTLVASL
jgi:hypothetical protein